MPVRDCYSNSEIDKLPFEELLNDFNNSYNILLDHKHNRANISKVIKIFHNLIYHSQFYLLPILNSNEFVEAFSDIILLTQLSDKKCCLEIIGNIWSCVEDISTPLTDQELIENVIGICKETNQSNITPSAYFAVANYCAISKETRDQVVNLKIINPLQHYMTRETVPDHVWSGLRLSLNILLNGIDDIWDEIMHLISKFRFHIISNNQKNRSLAAKCLILIVQNGQYIDKCLEQKVDVTVYESIIKLKYNRHVFDLALLFVQAGIYEEYINTQFIDYCNSLLDEYDEDIPLFFDFLSELMPNINAILYQNGIIDKILPIALDASFENMKSATFCLIKFMEISDSQTKVEIAINGAFEACCRLIGTHIDSNDYLFYILSCIYDLLNLDTESFTDIANENNLGEILDDNDFEDQDCQSQAQLILDLLSEHEDI